MQNNARTSCQPPGERAVQPFPWPPSCSPSNQGSHARGGESSYTPPPWTWPPSWSPPTLPLLYPPVHPSNSYGVANPTVLWSLPWCPPSSPNPTEPWWWLISKHADAFEPINFLLTNYPEEVDQIFSLVQKEMAGRSLPIDEKQIVPSYAATLNELIPKIINSVEGQQIINKINADHLNPSARIPAAGLVGLAVGVLIGVAISEVLHHHPQ
jgi:hypothetical protein